MKSIGARFSLVVSVLAVLVLALVVYRIRTTVRSAVEFHTARESEVALALEVAMRDYISKVIRPELEARISKDEFLVDAMSTTFIARRVFDQLRAEFPDYTIRFASLNPRNPVNLAEGSELEILGHFQENRGETHWSGQIDIGGKAYYARSRAMRAEKECIRCHGKPEDSPKSLLARYGDKGGFGFRTGDLMGMELVAVPIITVESAIQQENWRHLAFALLSLGLLFAAILITFRRMVTLRLQRIGSYFRRTAEQPDRCSLTPVPVLANDEIGMLAASFNTLAARLTAMHETLESRVQQRTAALVKGKETLKHLLDASDRERQLIAYEIHDGMAQDLAAAIMYLETHKHLKPRKPEDAEKALDTATAMVHRCLEEARRLISGVRPPILDEQGVEAAVDHLVQDCRRQFPGRVIVSSGAVNFDRLAHPLENAIYRIVQEGLSNALRHSRSEKIEVELSEKDQVVLIRVEDWGVGFDAAAGAGFGLEGIRERTRLLGEDISMETAPGRGTRLLVTLPLTLPNLIE